MQVEGEFRQGELATILTTADSERVTGSLTLSRDGHSDATQLYFLFGHLIHADSRGQRGEAAVFDALEWVRGRYRFNPRAMLTPDQTIRARTRDLLVAAGYADAGETPSQASGRSLNRWLLGPQAESRR